MAQTDDDAPQSVRGKVQNRYEEDGERVTEPVPDVRIVVEDAGTPIGEAVTDADGNYFIGLEQTGTFTVRLDVSTLPDGLAVAEGEDVQEVEVAGNQNVTRVFFLGEDTRDVQSKWSLLPQTLANGLKLAMIIGITSIGLSLIFGTTGSVELLARRDGHLRCIHDVHLQLRLRLAPDPCCLSRGGDLRSVRSRASTRVCGGRCGVEEPA